MKFTVTNELGKLARWLRILGFDTAYDKESNFSSLIVKSLRESRLILTRKKTNIENLGKLIFTVNSEDFRSQLKEVISRLSLNVDNNNLFTRCAACNTLLEGTEKEAVKELLPEEVARSQADFKKCPRCNKIYWQGSHCEKIEKVIANL